MSSTRGFSKAVAAAVVSSLFLPSFLCDARQAAGPKPPTMPFLSARAAIILDAADGGTLYAKNPHLRLPPASTTKLMTVLVAMEKLPLWKRVKVSRRAAAAERSRADLTVGADYSAGDLVLACLVSSSNDAAIALAEAVAGDERSFAVLMNQRALKLGMKNTRFVNATGLPQPGAKQYSTAYDLSLLIHRAVRDTRIDHMLSLTEIRLAGSDGKPIKLKSHNKMLWRTPKYVKGKTGWTFASRHTFAGTDYTSPKRIVFAMLASTEPWTDIERLATFGHKIERRR